MTELDSTRVTDDRVSGWASVDRPCVRRVSSRARSPTRRSA